MHGTKEACISPGICRCDHQDIDDQTFRLEATAVIAKEGFRAESRALSTEGDPPRRPLSREPFTFRVQGILRQLAAIRKRNFPCTHQYEFARADLVARAPSWARRYFSDLLMWQIIAALDTCIGHDNF